MASCTGSSETTDGTQPTTIEVSPSETASEAEPAAVASPGADGLTGTVAIVDVRVFDGIEVRPRATVIFENGLIAAVGSDAEVPTDAQVVDGRGKTLCQGSSIHTPVPSIEVA